MKNWGDDKTIENEVGTSEEGANGAEGNKISDNLLGESSGEDILQKKVPHLSRHNPNADWESSSTFANETSKSTTEESFDSDLITSPTEETTKSTSFREEYVSGPTRTEESAKEEWNRGTVREETTKEGSTDDSNSVSKESSSSREEIHGYKAKKGGKLLEYFHRYLNNSVTPSTMSPTASQANGVSRSVKVENELFERETNHKVDLNLLSRDRLSNEVPRDSTFPDQSIRDKIDNCTSKCAAFWKRAYEREKKKSRGAVDKNEKIDAGSISVEDTILFHSNEENCTDALDPEKSTETLDARFGQDTWKTTVKVTKTTESADLVEVFTVAGAGAPEPRKKKKGKGSKKKNKERAEKKKRKDRRKNKATEQPTTTRQETTAGFDDSRRSTWSYFEPTLFETTSVPFSSEGNFVEFQSKETVDGDKQYKHGVTSSSTEETASSTNPPATSSPSRRRCKNGEGTTTESSWWSWGTSLGQDSGEDCEDTDSTIGTPTATDFYETSRAASTDLYETSRATSTGSFEQELTENGVPSTTEQYVCEEDEFLCDGGLCIPESRVCNMVADCEDASDEADCDYYYGKEREHGERYVTGGGGTELPVACSEYEFSCDGRCVDNVYACDGFRDCGDGSDEAGCDDEGTEKSLGSDVGSASGSTSALRNLSSRFVGLDNVAGVFRRAPTKRWGFLDRGSV